MDWVESFVKLSTMGGFGALLWYIMVKYLPVIEERHRQEREKWNAAQAEVEAEVEARHRVERAEWLKYLERRDAQLDAYLTRRNS